MRYYDIKLTYPATYPDGLDDPLAGELVETTRGTKMAFTSWYKNQTDPNALNIELDWITSFQDIPSGNAWLRIWGLGVDAISQAADFVGSNITVMAGMQRGLPLANPAQQGTIITGQVYQCLGNWIGTDMTLDLYITVPFTGSLAQPANLTLDWKAGTPLAPALTTTLRTAYPANKGWKDPIVNISPALVTPSDCPHFVPSLTQLAQFLRQKSKDVIKGNYNGIDITVTQSQITVTDNTTTRPTTANTKAIQYQDLIGQPTWIDNGVIQFKCVMRGDIKVGTFVTLPPGFAITTQASQASVKGSLLRDKTTFQGTYCVKQVRNVGNFRQRDASAWVTVFDAFAWTSPNG